MLSTGKCNVCGEITVESDTCKKHTVEKKGNCFLAYLFLAIFILSPAIGMLFFK